MENKNNYSKNFLDIYSNSHVSWGILFGLFINILISIFWRGLYLTIILSVWEILKILNSSFVCIEKITVYGDSFINILLL